MSQLLHCMKASHCFHEIAFDRMMNGRPDNHISDIAPYCTIAQIDIFDFRRISVTLALRAGLHLSSFIEYADIVDFPDDYRHFLSPDAAAFWPLIFRPPPPLVIFFVFLLLRLLSALFYTLPLFFFFAAFEPSCFSSIFSLILARLRRHEAMACRFG